MIFSPSTEYALHALIYLSSLKTDRPAQVKDIAEAELIPRPFLAKIMNQLERRHLVHSVRGPGGGFRLARPAREIMAGDVITIFDDLLEFERVCILGLDKCSDKHSCPLHKEWKRFRSSLRKRVAVLTIDQMRRALEKKKKARAGFSSGR